MLTWITANKEWVFSGIGVLILALVGTVIRFGYRRWQGIGTSESKPDSISILAPSTTQEPSITEPDEEMLNAFQDSTPETCATTPLYLGVEAGSALYEVNPSLSAAAPFLKPGSRRAVGRIA